MQPEATIQPLHPSAYRVVEHRQHCTGCGCTHSYSQIFSVTSIPGRSGVDLKPIKRSSDVTWNLPIEYQRYRVEDVPFCHLCHSKANLSKLRPLPVPPTAALAPLKPVFRDTPPPRPKPEPKAPVRALTSDEL